MPGRVYECLNCGIYFQYSLTHLDPEYCSEECRTEDQEQMNASKLPEEYENTTIPSAEVTAALETVRAAGGFILKMSTEKE